MANTLIRDSAIVAKDHTFIDGELSPTSSTAQKRLRSLLSSVEDGLTNDRYGDVVQHLEELCGSLQELRVILIDTDHRYGRIKDDFRHAHGFHILLDLTGRIPSLWTLAGPSRSVFELLKFIFAILIEALHEHPINAQHFTNFEGPAGWKRLHKHLQHFLEKLTSSEATDFLWPWKLFDLLFCFALCEEGDTKILRQDDGQKSTDESGKQPELGYAVRMPEVLPIISELWINTIRSRHDVDNQERLVSLSLATLYLFQQLVSGSHYNAIAFAGSGADKYLFDYGIDGLIEATERASLQELRLDFLREGMLSSELALHIAKSALTGKHSIGDLSTATATTHQPPHIALDLSLHGYASLELDELHGEFPPPARAGGYSLMLWLRVDEFDEPCHTTLFGAYDSTQTSFLLLYLEKETKQLVLQTSVRSERPSVRFKSITFASRRWYHVAIIHKHPGNEKASRATLIVDGKPTEKIKCPYPLEAPAKIAPKVTPLSFSTPPTHKAPVHGFVGTPRRLSPRLGLGALRSRWSLASCQLVARALPEELVLVYTNLGPAYVGNFQDSLGSYQTYETSTRLNLLNEQTSSGAEDQSVIAKVIRGKASSIIDESSFLLNAIAGSFRHTTGLGRQDFDTGSVMRVTGGMANLAVPESVASPQDPKTNLICHGGIRLSSAKSMSQYIWQGCGGVSFAIKLLEVASTHTDVLQAVRIAFDLVRDNWRLSEAFEREGGFPMMAYILRYKTATAVQSVNQYSTDHDGDEPFSLRLLRLILSNVGHDERNPEASVISNPLAYRAMIVDSDLWRSSEGSTQRLYYKQFVDFIAKSHHASFNIRRLGRMRPVKRLMNALKSEQINREGLPFILQALESFLRYLPSSEAYRSTALYITYATSPQRSTQAATSKPSHGQSSATSSLSEKNRTHTTAQEKMSDQLPPSSFELGAQVLDVLKRLSFDDASAAHLRKFARTVTSKWLLYLLSCQNETIIAPTFQILCRLLVVQGHTYLVKFQETSNNLKLLGMRIRKWWSIGAIWKCCVAVLFGLDPLELSSQGQFDLTKIQNVVSRKANSGLYCTAIFPVMTGMLEAASSTTAHAYQLPHAQHTGADETSLGLKDTDSETAGSIDLITKVLRLFKDAQRSVPAFRDFCAQSEFTRQMLRCIFAGVRGSANTLSPGDGSFVKDLHNLDSTTREDLAGLTPGMRAQEQLVRTEASQKPRRRRQSSFVFVPTKESIQALTRESPHREEMPPAEKDLLKMFEENEILVLNVTVLGQVLARQIIDRRDFTGLGLFHKAPPCSFDLRASVNAYVLRETMQILQQMLETASSRFNEPKVLMNVVKFSMQALEAYMEGWLVYGAMNLIQFNVAFLQFWQQPEVQAIKEVRLCSPSLQTMRSSLAHTTLFYIVRATDSFAGLRRLSDIASLPGWANAMKGPRDDQEAGLGPLFCVILRLLPQADLHETEHAKMLLTSLTEDRSEDVLSVFDGTSMMEYVELLYDLVSALHGSNEAFRDWLAEHQSEIEKISVLARNSILMPFIAREEDTATDSVNARSAKRKERLEQWHLEDLKFSHTWMEHQTTARNWTDNIARSESYKYTRSLQDQNESFEYLRFNMEKLLEPLGRLGFIEASDDKEKWQLDECEGRDRMRLRLSPAQKINEIGYESKSTKISRRRTQSILGSQSTDSSRRSSLRRNGPVDGGSPTRATSSTPLPEATNETFELIADQANDDDDEDKNRKVMRSLQRGETVVNVFNISRIVGLEAHEGLLIIGRTSLYLVDGLFQRSDGEVVNVDQAPSDERDQYTRILSGHELEASRLSRRTFEPTRYWPWSDILSFSKRIFLTRPVAIEIFFTDGRSYLLTTPEEAQRTALYEDLFNSTSKTRDVPQAENEAAWRKDLLRNPQEGGSKFAQILSPMVANPMTKRWTRGEVSNFHYLMWVNSQAGRTFNDLTQYPVFPWVLADYTSEELDLSNPRSFRDLSKPMGCQTIERAESFQERYQSLAEMDEQSPPFHYGTHYSSAMIITTFLIRLQPFVQSHILLQGGSFDHANRLFHSVEQAWRSASREGLSDVRELIPEFYYLPDFLVNVNKYDFGLRQGDNEQVDHVKLPPWAKGSPEIFIAKHREALESPYVSQNLHAWIDLVFGFKQRGEAALESTNVFHYLSYPGAKDLDNIHDQHERAATIGIIHNFGQTPRQIILRPHDRREKTTSKSAKLRENMRSLARQRSPVYDLKSTVSSLHYSKQLVAAAAGTSLPPVACDFIADWIVADHSIRFYTADRRKRLGFHEQLHEGAITCSTFADAWTYFTGSDDTTVSAWHVHNSGEEIQLHLRSTLFGHRSLITVISVSRAFSVLLTADINGVIILWDLSRLDFIREVHVNANITSAVVSNSSGRILVAAEQTLLLYTNNGRRLLKQNVCDEDERLSTAAFYQQPTNAWYDSEIVLSGHSKGVIKIWSLIITSEGKWVLESLNRLPTDRFLKGGGTPSVTALLAQEGKVWAGDAHGHVYEWSAVK